MTQSVGVLLFAAIGGYWVLERAERQKGKLKRVGQFLGWLIIVVSLVGTACRVWYLATCTRGSSGKGWYCPYFPKKPSTPPSEAPAEPGA